MVQKNLNRTIVELKSDQQFTPGIVFHNLNRTIVEIRPGVCAQKAMSGPDSRGAVCMVCGYE